MAEQQIELELEEEQDTEIEVKQDEKEEEKVEAVEAEKLVQQHAETTATYVALPKVQPGELAAWTLVASTLLNLDEAQTRE